MIGPIFESIAVPPEVYNPPPDDPKWQMIAQHHMYIRGLENKLEAQHHELQKYKQYTEQLHMNVNLLGYFLAASVIFVTLYILWPK